MPEPIAIARPMPVTRLLSASLALMLLVACGKAPPSAPPPPPEVSVAEVVSREITEWDEYTGHLEAKDTVEIRPQVSGVLQRIAFIEGKEVKKGDLLFQIDPRPFQAELDRALAEAERARTAADLAAAELARAEQLSSSNVISKELYEQRRAASRSAAAAVRGAEAAQETARLNMAYTRIVSPIAGRIGRAEVTPGNLVNGEGGSATLLATVVSMQPMYAYFEAAEQDYLKYMDLARSGERPLSRDVKNPVFMSVGNESDFSHQGYMDFVDNRVRTGTGTLQGRAVFPNPDRHLTPGMFVRVRLIGSGKYQGLLINDRAIATDQDRRYVLVVGADNKIEYRALTTGPVVDGLRVVREGLKGGERIVVNGLQRVRPGMQITPKLVPMEGSGTAPSAAAAAE